MHVTSLPSSYGIGDMGPAASEWVDRLHEVGQTWWESLPGVDFLSSVETELGALPFIAEDLGLITADVHAIRDQFHIPGTRVLRFAFDGHSDNPHIPENYVSNSVVYTGTHDNPTTRGWFEELQGHQRQTLWRYLKRPSGESCEAAAALMELARSSVGALTMAPLQDLLNLGKEARMNVPGRAAGNWRWRATEDMLHAPAFDWLRNLTRSSNRLGVLRSALTDTQPALLSGHATEVTR
jgi:4-alpha-glucanotransferase